jgi:hypothetical protein
LWLLIEWLPGHRADPTYAHAQAEDNDVEQMLVMCQHQPWC